MELTTQSFWRRALRGGVMISLAVAATSVAAKDYLLTSVHSNKLVLVDVAARKVEKTYPLPSAPGNTPGTIATSPDGKVAYVLHNRWETVSGIDLDTGKEVFRADLSGPGMRVKSIPLALSPDGKEIAIYVMPVALLPDEYKVQDTRIDFYDTSAGLEAKPIRSIPAPRRTSMVAYSPDGSRLYAMAADCTVMDPKDGKVIGSHPLQHLKIKNRGEPTTFSLWPLWASSNVIAFGYGVVRTDRKWGAPDFVKAGIYQLDLAADKVTYKEYENMSALLFGTTINPVRRNEAYGAYVALSKVDTAKGKLMKRVDLEQTYYEVQVSSDGKELYVGGAGAKIAVYDTANLNRLATIDMPDLAEQGLAHMWLFSR